MMISIVIISKDEGALDDTLTDAAKQATDLNHPWEIVVVDASDRRLDHIRLRHQADVRWLRFEQPAGVRISIPHQRNVGVRAAHGDIVIFTDAGCRLEPGWLTQLIGPLLDGETVTAGLTLSIPGSTELYDRAARRAMEAPYLGECGTVNLAFLRMVFDAVDGFDESFAYGSDIDFTWRLNDAGYRIRSVPAAVVRSDWGGWRRQLRRSYVYGRARVRLLRKHRRRLRQILRDNPLVVVYPAFITGLPLTLPMCFLGSPLALLAALYPALLIIPAWRNRSEGAVKVLADHLTYGLGALAELVNL
jgi:glycosyltransferase involved in cell wall biosynthesis